MLACTQRRAAAMSCWAAGQGWGGEAVGDIDADQTVGDRPQHEVVVERAVVAALVTGDKAAAVHEDKYRTRRVV